MPNYLLHETSDGVPVGVYTSTSDYYDPEYQQLESEGRELVYSKLPTASWNDFINRLADTKPSRTMRWDVYYDPSSNLEAVLAHAKRDLEQTGQPESE